MEILALKNAIHATKHSAEVGGERERIHEIEDGTIQIIQLNKKKIFKI